MRRGDPAQASQGIGREVSRGAIWSFANNIIIRGASFVSGIVLARILVPDEFGEFAVALSILVLLESMNELGVSLAVVRWEKELEKFVPTTMSIAVLSSSLIYLVTYFLAPVYADAMDVPHATTLIRVLCFAVVFDGIAVVPAGVLNRLFLQRQRFVCDALSFGMGTGLTILLAATGSGAMSFGWGRLAANLVSVVCYIALCPISLRPGWDRAEAKALVQFGLPLAGASLLILGVSNVDNIVVGASLGPTALGFYLMAFNQSSWPLQIFSEAARRVSLAGFSRLVATPVRFNRAIRRGLGLLSAAALPTCVLLLVYAEPMLAAVYGAKWLPAAVPLRFLAIFGLLRVGFFICYDAIVAVGKTRVLMTIQALWLASLIPALILAALGDGIRGVAVAQVCVALLVTTPAFLFVLDRAGVSPRTLLGDCGRPVLGGCAIALSALVVLHVIHGAWPQLLIGTAVALVVYIPIVWPMQWLLPGRSRYEPAHLVGPRTADLVGTTSGS